MYPQGELNELARTRDRLQSRIAGHRAQCVQAAAGLTPPLALMDRGLALWRNVSPVIKIAAVPLLLFLKHKIAARINVMGSLLRWLPVLFGLRL